jgi:hypothetical protein
LVIFNGGSTPASNWKLHDHVDRRWSRQVDGIIKCEFEPVVKLFPLRDKDLLKKKREGSAAHAIQPQCREKIPVEAYKVKVARDRCMGISKDKHRSAPWELGEGTELLEDSIALDDWQPLVQIVAFRAENLP